MQRRALDAGARHGMRVLFLLGVVAVLALAIGKLWDL